MDETLNVIQAAMDATQAAAAVNWSPSYRESLRSLYRHLREAKAEAAAIAAKYPQPAQIPKSSPAAPLPPACPWSS